MAELRWILLGLGLVVLVAIYVASRFRDNRADRKEDDSRVRVEPSIGAGVNEDAKDDESSAHPPEPPAPPPAKLPEMVVTLRLMSKDRAGFPGDKLVLAMRSAGLRHGQFGIFHAHSTDDPDGVLFSVANLVEPGTFDLASLSNSRLPGVSLFMLLPGPGSASETLDAMLATARKLATALNGELLDEHGSSLSVQRERYIRDEIQQFVRQNLAAAAGPGRSG